MKWIEPEGVYVEQLAVFVNGIGIIEAGAPVQTGQGLVGFYVTRVDLGNPLEL